MFTKGDTGCHADGTFGHSHIRTALAGLIGGYTCNKSNEAYDSLSKPMPDDAWDEDEALEILQSHTEPGLIWLMDSGDLMLMDESEVPK